jgi:uncharacterized protein YjdB
MKKTTKFMSLLCLSLAMVAFTFTSCDDDEKAEVALKFDKATVEVAVGETSVVTVNNGTSPFTADPAATDLATAAVDNNKITIKGVKVGTTTITVTDKEKNTGKINVKIIAAEEEEEA